MCTASWRIGESRLDLLFNRDEHRTRGKALPPRVVEESGARFLAPVDPDAGGTWIGASDAGFGVALLNAWHVHTAAATRSRGLLVRELLGARGPADASSRLAALDLAPYAGFVVLLLAPGRAPEAFAWDGERLASPRPSLPTTSSGFDPEGVQRTRSAVFAELIGGKAAGLDALERFHASHAPERGTLSPCMHRDEVGTVSVTHLGLRADRVFLRYAPGPLCERSFGERVELPRRVA